MFKTQLPLNCNALWADLIELVLLYKKELEKLTAMEDANDLRTKQHTRLLTAGWLPKQVKKLHQ